MVAPTGRAFVFQDEAASSAVREEVEAERYLANSLAHISIGIERAHGSISGPEMESCEVGGAAGWNRMTGGRTEAVLLVALRVAAPIERAERKADRANMVL